MPYITREDGERFVIPSYRDVLTAKRKSVLKRQILQLSTNYGEYITLQRRGLTQYEIAFSPDAGYLLGESIWQYFKRPADMVYCEAIKDTTEAILVIVKEGGVYLDGTFPLDSIAEELLVFKTQQTNFEVYIYGDVPISEQAEDGKFSFDSTAIKSFKVLDEPIFSTLPGAKNYQLKLVDVALREQGIGVFPIKPVLAIVVVLGLAWMAYSYITAHISRMPTVSIAPPPPNPYLEFYNTLKSPEPSEEIEMVLANMVRLLTLPGWVASDINYSNGKMTFSVKSLGTNIDFLYSWAQQNNVAVQLISTGFVLTMMVDTPPPRTPPGKIYPLDNVIINLLNRVATVLHGNVLQVSAYVTKGVFKVANVTIRLDSVSPSILVLLAEQLRGLPLVLTNMTLNINDSVSGSINLQALGN